MFLLIVCYCVC